MTVLSARLRAFSVRLIRGIPWPVRRALVGIVQVTLVEIIKWGSRWQAADETSQRFCHHTLLLSAPDPLKTNLIAACSIEEATSPGPIP